MRHLERLATDVDGAPPVPKKGSESFIDISGPIAKDASEALTLPQYCGAKSCDAKVFEATPPN